MLGQIFARVFPVASPHQRRLAILRLSPFPGENQSHLSTNSIRRKAAFPASPPFPPSLAFPFSIFISCRIDFYSSCSSGSPCCCWGVYGSMIYVESAEVDKILFGGGGGGGGGGGLFVYFLPHTRLPHLPPVSGQKSNRDATVGAAVPSVLGTQKEKQTERCPTNSSFQQTR